MMMNLLYHPSMSRFRVIREQYRRTKRSTLVCRTRFLRRCLSMAKNSITEEMKETTDFIELARRIVFQFLKQREYFESTCA